MAKMRRIKGLFVPEKANCVTIFSGKRLVMESVERIVFCSEEKMILEGKKRLVILGDRLFLQELGNDNMQVCGHIRSVSFEEVAP